MGLSLLISIPLFASGQLSQLSPLQLTICHNCAGVSFHQLIQLRRLYPLPIVARCVSFVPGFHPPPISFLQTSVSNHYVSVENLRGKSQFKHHCYQLYHYHHHHHDQNEQNHKIPMNQLAHLGPRGGPSYKWLSHSARETEPVQGNNYVGIDAILSIQYATDGSIQHSWLANNLKWQMNLKGLFTIFLFSVRSHILNSNGVWYW